MRFCGTTIESGMQCGQEKSMKEKTTREQLQAKIGVARSFRSCAKQNR